MNAGYALRQNLKDSYGAIVDFIQNHHKDEYSLNEVLRLWLEKTNDINRLKNLIESVPTSQIRWHAIRLLEDLGGHESFLQTILTQIMENPEEELDDRIFAANHMLPYDNQQALEFLADRILTHPETSFDYRINLGNIAKLKSTNAIPVLLDLLTFAKQPEFKFDVFNDLESPALKGLFAVGTQSTENFLEVNAALRQFIDQNTGKLPNINYLNFTISNMDEELRKKQATELNIGAALEEYKRFTR